jgi:hypothetical protein
MMNGPKPEDIVPGVHSWIGPKLHNETFWKWLKDDVGITRMLSTIVMAVGEKLSMVFPDIYDPSIYDDEEEQEES